MKTSIKFLVMLGLATALPGGFRLLAAGDDAEKKPATKEAKPAPDGAQEKSRVSHGTNGEVILTLDAATQQRIGLKVATLAATKLPPVVRGFGRALDPLPLIQLAADLAPAEVSAEASRKEFERLKTLRAQDNASERALQAAEAQARRDRLLAESLRAKLLFAWGRSIAEPDRLPALARALAAMQTALVRVDVPAGERLPGQPTGAQLLPLTADAPPIAAEFVGAATSTDPQLQGQGFLFLVRSNAPAAGAALTGWIQTDGPPANGVLVPADAIVRHENKGWAYVQTGEDKFTRREAGLGRAHGAGYFVTSGFAAGEKVVTTGAQILLSEELKGQSEE